MYICEKIFIHLTTMKKFYVKKRKMISVYLDTKDSVLLLSKDHSFHILYYIINQSDSERNIWFADIINKEKIIEKLQISPSSLDKHLKSLVDRKLILKDGSRGRYKLNMSIFSM